jgi:hypothetical protein
MKKIISVLVVMVLLVGCQDIKMSIKDIEKDLFGLSSTVRTFDSNGDVIDRIVGKSVKIERNRKFDTEKSDSSVVKVTMGGKEINHVGSSMILSESGLEDILDSVDVQQVVENSSRKSPFLNTIVNDYKNSLTGLPRLVMVRSQLGFPLAVYEGDKVSIYSTEIPNSTALLIDGKLLILYRVDYTIYDTSLLVK